MSGNACYQHSIIHSRVLPYRTHPIASADGRNKIVFRTRERISAPSTPLSLRKRRFLFLARSGEFKYCRSPRLPLTEVVMRFKAGDTIHNKSLRRKVALCALRLDSWEGPPIGPRGFSKINKEIVFGCEKLGRAFLSSRSGPASFPLLTVQWNVLDGSRVAVHDLFRQVPVDFFVSVLIHVGITDVHRAHVCILRKSERGVGEVRTCRLRHFLVGFVFLDCTLSLRVMHDMESSNLSAFALD